MSDEADLDAYLRRVNYAGSIAPTFDTLDMLHRMHATAIPYETLDPMLDKPVRLGLRDIEQKLIFERRGGNAFEHNLLFKGVLESMDFVVTPLSATVLEGRETPSDKPDHMVLLVDVSGTPYLADLGFGAQVLPRALRLKADLEQQAGGETYRLTGGYPQWRLERQSGDEWIAMYEFMLTPRSMEDFGAMNEIATAQSRDRLRVARLDGTRRHVLRDAFYSVTEGGETTADRTIGSLIEMRDVLSNVFGLELPAGEKVDAALERALKRAVVV